MMALNITMASQAFAACVRLTLVGWLAPGFLQAAAERFPWNDGIDLHQGVMLGIQSGVTLLDIEKTHLSHVQLLRPFG